LEKISSLKNRYGSIDEALRYVELKRAELKGYKNIEEDKSMLEDFLAMEYGEISVIAARITALRKTHALKLEKELMHYLNELKLPAITFNFEQKSLDIHGQDGVEIELDGSGATTLSGGEFNRVRLALMVVALTDVKDGGVLILDEIDANVSGDESIAIANMIAKLSKVYQIFAISHQAHLAAKATEHILVHKDKEGSHAVILDKIGRINEISRIIGGEKPNSEAISFAEKLLINL
jgi:DNA repair protein RecN (Recombination protein N)